ncbi:MAG TPA: hypothetical protein VGR72_01595 [Candidatus Acidoferrales bacterium]|nr:hypothetical protein [Candidatus Acidoferrales bacterium]
MGRTIPTFVQLVEQAVQRWAKFRRALRREDQKHFDRLFLRVRSYTQAAAYQCNDNPMEAILLSIALDQEKRLSILEKLLCREGISDATPRLDSRPLFLPAGDGVVAADAEPDSAQAD